MPFDLVERCELVGRFLSGKLDYERVCTRERTERSASERVAALIAQLPPSAAVGAALEQHERALIDLVGAAGVAVFRQGKLHLSGRTPSEADVHELLRWLRAQPGATEYATTSIAEHIPAAARYAHQAAGMLCASLPDARPSYVMWFRPEVVHTVSWGGNPEDHEPRAASKLPLGPRRSFEL